MNATGFTYDGLSTENFGLIICKIDSTNGIETINVGSELNWNTVPIQHGAKYLVTNTAYDSVLEMNFQVCKYDCENGITAISFEDQREITRWLNRKEHHLLTFISDDIVYNYIGFEGSFNISKIELNEEVIGYELHFTSNRPFAVGRPVQKTIKADTTDYIYKLYDISDEIGYIYPKNLVIKCLSDGTLTIHNSIEDRTLKINNCSNGEIITFDDNLNITTSLPSHQDTIQNDFNYSYFRIANSYYDRLNILTISIPCEITIKYIPIVKGIAF